MLDLALEYWIGANNMGGIALSVELDPAETTPEQLLADQTLLGFVSDNYGLEFSDMPSVTGDDGARYGLVVLCDGQIPDPQAPLGADALTVVVQLIRDDPPVGAGSDRTTGAEDGEATLRTPAHVDDDGRPAFWSQQLGRAVNDPLFKYWQVEYPDAARTVIDELVASFEQIEYRGSIRTALSVNPVMMQAAITAGLNLARVGNGDITEVIPAEVWQQHIAEGTGVDYNGEDFNGVAGRDLVALSQLSPQLGHTLAPVIQDRVAERDARLEVDLSRFQTWLKESLSGAGDPAEWPNITDEYVYGEHGMSSLPDMPSQASRIESRLRRILLYPHETPDFNFQSAYAAWNIANPRLASAMSAGAAEQIQTDTDDFSNVRLRFPNDVKRQLAVKELFQPHLYPFRNRTTINDTDFGRLDPEVQDGVALNLALIFLDVTPPAFLYQPVSFFQDLVDQTTLLKQQVQTATQRLLRSRDAFAEQNRRDPGNVTDGQP